MLLQSAPGLQQTQRVAPQTQSRPLLVHMPQPLAACPCLACDCAGFCVKDNDDPPVFAAEPEAAAGAVRRVWRHCAAFLPLLFLALAAQHAVRIRP